MSLFRSSKAAPADENRTLTLPFNLSQLVGNYGSVGDPATGETSLQSIALRSTADLIASLASELPANVYRNGRRVKGGVPDNLEDPGGDGMGREDWIYRLVMSWLTRGNTYGKETSWDSRTARAKTVDLLHPDDVRATDSAGSVDWYVKGRKLDGADRLAFRHWRVNPVAGRALGLSPVAAHAATIGVSLSSTQFGRQWFTDGAHPSGILSNEAALKDGDADTAKAKFMAAIRGKREPLVLGKGWDWKQIQINPNESQFLETIGATEAQCARIFGPGFAEIMGYESGGSMTYANVVDRRQDLLVFSMGKWLRRVDRILTALLPPSTLEVRLNRDALLETTTLQRYQVHEIALRNQIRSVNEVREIEDLEPVAWGDQPNAATPPPNGAASGNPA